MVARVEVQGFLYQSTAVKDIAEHFGDEFTYRNEEGTLAIVKPVLQAFYDHLGDAVYWDHGTQAWRLGPKIGHSSG